MRSRCSSDRICRLTAGWVTPSCSAACEKLRRSTTAQNAASCRVSISNHYAWASATERRSIQRIEDTFIRGYRQLALETPARPRDVLLRVLDILLSALFLVLTLPVVLP